MPISTRTEDETTRLVVANRNNHHSSRSKEQRVRESMQCFSLLLQQTRIIPAVRSPEFLLESSRAPGKIVYFLFGNPENTAEMMELVAEAGKVPIVNIDLAAGLARDQAAVSFLAHR